MAWNRWKPYVSVAQRRQQALRQMKALRKQGVDIQPIEIEGLKIAKTFWGAAWCDHLESFSDFSNRLPRGRTYVRNGSVCHLAIEKGTIDAKVMGSEIYEIQVRIETLSSQKWKNVKQQCSGQIGSLLELLRGNLSENIMQVVTDQEDGLFPLPGEISLECDCPDWAVMCKHVAAVLYGVGARLDQDPALLFRLRGVNHDELIDADVQVVVPGAAGRGGAKRLASDELGDVFGIDLVANEPASASDSAARVKGKAKKKAKSKKRSTKKSPSPKRPAAKRKASSRSAAKNGTDKVAVRKKKAVKVAKKTTGRKSKKKKTSARTVLADQVKRTATRKTAKKKTAQKKTVKKASRKPVSRV